MIFSQNAVGLEICREGMRFSSISARKNTVSLDGYIISPLQPGTLKLSHREPNVTDPGAFVDGVRSSFLRLLAPVSRVSVSLPDTVGRVLLLDLETRFKSRDEGADIIRWKLRKSGFQDVQEMHLDYRTLGERETGEVRALVSMISTQVVNQYEDLLGEAGLEPNIIDFTSFSICRFFSERLDTEGTLLFVSCYGALFSMFIVSGGTLEFYRCKEIPPGDGEAVRLYQEITNSLLASREKNSGKTPDRAIFVAARHRVEELGSIISEAAALDPVWLDFRNVVVPGSGITLDQETAFLLTGSVGAALRNL
jgi:type IV pilus assembly protein PilM